MTEEHKRKISEANKAVWAAKKQRRENSPLTPAASQATIRQKVAALEFKVNNYEQLIQSYKMRNSQLENKINGMVLEYNARLKYMKECVEHAYTSILFAENAAKPITKIKSEVQVND